MDNKTKLLMAVEAILIIALVVVVAMDYNSEPMAEEMETAAAIVEEVEEEAHEAAHEEVHEAEAHAEKAHAEEAHVAEDKAEAHEAAPAKEEKADAHAKHAEKADAHAQKEAPAKEEKAETAKTASNGEFAHLDVIALNNPAYEHTRPIVQFSHKAHIEDYGIGCGECHHDDTGQPLNDLKMGDEVQGCFDCHDQPGKAPKEVKGPEALQYHVNALHANCIDCHKEYNKAHDTKAAPQSCATCHIKEG